MYALVISISFLERETQVNIHERNRDENRCGSDDGSGREHLSSNVSGRYLGAGKKKFLCGLHDLLGSVVWCGCIFIVDREETTEKEKLKYM